MLFHHDYNINMANYFSSPFVSSSLLMKEEEEEMQDEALWLNDD